MSQCSGHLHQEPAISTPCYPDNYAANLIISVDYHTIGVTQRPFVGVRSIVPERRLAYFLNLDKPEPFG